MDRTVRHASMASPSLTLPVLAASAGEVVESSALRVLTVHALEGQRKQREAAKKEKKQVMKREKERVTLEALDAMDDATLRQFARGDSSSSSFSAKRKEKEKRRKKRRRGGRGPGGRV